MNLEEKINQKYEVLSANDRELITIILRERKSVCEMSSTQLASFLHVSRTTLVRLQKKLGIDSFMEFKLLLKPQTFEPVAISYPTKAIVQNYHRMIDELQKRDYENACRMLYQADTIYLYGTGNEQKSIVDEFKRIFLMLGKSCVNLFDYGELAYAKQRFVPKDLLVVISLSGESEEALRIVRSAQETAIGTLSLTRWENNSLAHMCQENLYVGTQVIRQNIGQPYEQVAAFYVLLDILAVHYIEYQNRCVREKPYESG